MPGDFRSRIILSAKSNAAGVFNKTGTAAAGVTRSLGNVAKAGAAAGIAMAAVFAAKTVKNTIDFGAAVGDLSAITGATGADLQFLSEKALEFGRTTTLSASQAVEAFKLVASAKPDLLGNLDALTAVTEQSILLSEATGIELTGAALIVGESLNQFGEGASQAARFVDVLAASSKFGSSEVAQTAEALRNAGVAGKQAGLSFEETNAAIQTLAASGIKGSDAGTKLRSALIKLQTQANDDFNPAIVGMNQALDNLADANLDVTDRVELFGERSLVVGDILIQNRDLFDKLEVQVTGTATALEQASARNDNLAGDLKQLNSAFEGLTLQIGSKFDPVMRSVTQIMTAITNQITEQSSEVDGLSTSFEQLDELLRGVVATFSFLDTIITAIGTTMGATVAVIVKVLSGEFSDASDIIALAFEDIKEIIVEGAEDAAEIATGTTARGVIRTFTDPAVLAAAEEGGLALGGAINEGVRSAGERAAAEEAEAAFEAFAKKIERIREQNLAEETILMEKLAIDLALIQEARDTDLLSLAEFLEIKFNLEKAAADKLKKLQMKGATTGAKFEMMTSMNKTKFIVGQLQTITAGAATENKAMFRINQAAGIANAVINTAEGITEMLTLPWPLNLAMAAVVAAAGAIQIGAISSAKFGGGTTPSFSASSPSIRGTPVDSVPPPSIDSFGPGGGAVRTIDINISGLDTAGMVSSEVVRELMASINEELGDGVNINVDGGSGGGT